MKCVQAAAADNVVKQNLIDMTKFPKDTKLIFSDFVTHEWATDKNGKTYLGATFLYQIVDSEDLKSEEESTLKELQDFLTENKLTLGELEQYDSDDNSELICLYAHLIED